MIHRVGEQLLFEVPTRALNVEMLLISRPVESTLQNPAGFFGGGMRQIVQWERMGNRVVLRAKRHDLMADSTSAIWRVVSGFRKGAVLSAFNVSAYGADSAAVVDVTELFLSNIPELAPVAGIQRNKSWVERTWAFPDNVNIEVTQTGLAPAAPTGPAAFGSPAAGQPRSQTARLQFSMLKLPDVPMMPRWEDERVGYIASSFFDMSNKAHRAKAQSFIHRFKLVKKDPAAAVSDPVEPIVYWIDPATPDWMKPWIVSGVNAWQDAFRKAGFSNAIFGRVAPTPAEDPNFSLYDARNSVIYWRPSTVANATGGQIVDQLGRFRKQRIRQAVAHQADQRSERERRDQAARDHDRRLAIAEDVADREQRGGDFERQLRFRQERHEGRKIRLDQAGRADREFDRGAHAQA